MVQEIPEPIALSRVLAQEPLQSPITKRKKKGLWNGNGSNRMIFTLMKGWWWNVFPSLHLLYCLAGEGEGESTLIYYRHKDTCLNYGCKLWTFFLRMFRRKQ